MPAFMVAGIAAIPPERFPVPSIPYDSSRTALFSPALHPTLFQAGQNYSHVQLGLEAARLAYLKFELKATLPQEAIKLDQALALVGFGQVKAFNNPQTGSQGFGAYRPSDKLALLAFRGTEAQERTDLSTDADFKPIPWSKASGHVHRGFAAGVLSLWPDVEAWLNKDVGARASLLICGHSLGAALATLVASVPTFRTTSLVTIGSPRVGDEGFAQCFVGQGITITRVVNCCDVVPHLPPETPLPLYTHVSPMAYIDREGLRVSEPATGGQQEDQWRARAQYLVDHAWRKGSVEVRDLADHAPINYIRAYF